LLYYVCNFFCVSFFDTCFLFVTCNEFVGKDHFDTRVGVFNVVSNGATKVFIIPWVHDSFITFASRGHLEVFLLTSLLGFFFLTIMLLLLL
jgi:hypothetical protein